MQATRATRANIAYTWLRARGTAPTGGVASGYDSSLSKTSRPNHMPYYAHFRITVTPGTLLRYNGYMRLRSPIPVPGGRLTGLRYGGACAAR